jgi:hypothetical protein
MDSMDWLKVKNLHRGKSQLFMGKSMENPVKIVPRKPNDLVQKGTAGSRIQTAFPKDIENK